MKQSKRYIVVLLGFSCACTISLISQMTTSIAHQAVAYSANTSRRSNASDFRRRLITSQEINRLYNEPPKWNLQSLNAKYGVAPLWPSNAVHVNESVVPLYELEHYNAYRHKVLNWPNWSFKYILKPRDDACSRHASLFAVMVIHTSPYNYVQREFLRDTYGSKLSFSYSKFALVFAIGSSLDEEIMGKVAQENAQFEDIIQGDFLDDYRNLTEKSIMWLKWSANYCPDVLFTIKSDDDIFIDPFRLAQHMSQTYKKDITTGDSIMCAVHWYPTMYPVRDTNDKWYVPTWMYKNGSYPTYCSGSLYIINQGLLPKLYDNFPETRYLWVDDTYTTGVLAESLNVTYHDIGSLYILQFDYDNSTAVSSYFLNDLIMVGHTHIDKQARYALWHQMLSQKGLKDTKSISSNASNITIQMILAQKDLFRHYTTVKTTIS